MDPKTTTEENILALSWHIATEPKLYKQLAPNPYSPASIQIISEKFPNESHADVVKAVVLAEQEGRYDRNFRLLGALQQADELQKQRDISAEKSTGLAQFCNEYAKELAQLSKEYVYNSLFVVVFKTADLQEVEEKYAQNQRKCIKLLILHFIESLESQFVKQEQEGELFKTEKSASKTQFVVSKPGKIFLAVAFAVLSSISFFYLYPFFLDKHTSQAQTRGTVLSQKVKEKILPIETQKTARGLPRRLIIPSINVDAVVENVGLTPQGAMDVPGNTFDVGWYRLGPSPGERGSAVISGHFDGRVGESGVFNNLDKLKPGDRIYVIYVINDQETTATFVVRESHTYRPGYADEVFSSRDNGTHLNLITCDGAWDGAKRSYSKRLVVFADITP